MMTIKQTLKTICTASVLLFISSCQKGGTGGNNEIAAFPKHHGKSIPGAVVYIKYDAKEFPGEDVSKYDASGIAKIMMGEDPHVHFEELKRGYYYLYSVGYDSAIAQVVKGGIGIHIKTKDGETDVDVPVTE